MYDYCNGLNFRFDTGLMVTIAATQTPEFGFNSELIDIRNHPLIGGLTTMIINGFLYWLNFFTGELSPRRQAQPTATTVEGDEFDNGFINFPYYPCINGLKARIIFGCLVALSVLTTATQIRLDGLFCATTNNGIEYGLSPHITKIGFEFLGVIDPPNEIILFLPLFIYVIINDFTLLVMILGLLISLSNILHSVKYFVSLSKCYNNIFKQKQK